MFSSSSIVGIFTKLIDSEIGLDNFGISVIVLLFVIGTIFVNSIYGIRASIAKSKEYKKLGDSSYSPSAKKKYYRLSKKSKFSFSILEDVFFKVFILLLYLFMANFFVDRLNLKSNPILKLIDVTAQVFLVIPTFIYWYKEFLSIGKNYEKLKGRKNTFFKVLEDVIEVKLTNFVENIINKKDKDEKDG